MVSNIPVRNVVTFYAPKMGISLRRAPETGFVVVTKATPALRNGHVAPGDRVTEAIGVDLCNPITDKEFRRLDARLRDPASRPWPAKLTVERELEPRTRKPPNRPIGDDVGEARIIDETGRVFITAEKSASPIEGTYLTLVEELKRASGADRQGTWTVRRPGDNKNWTAKATTEISAQCNVDYALRVSGSTTGVKPQDWLLDTASTIMLTRRNNGLKFIHRAERRIRIASAGGVTTATERGYHEG